MYLAGYLKQSFCIFGKSDKMYTCLLLLFFICFQVLKLLVYNENKMTINWTFFMSIGNSEAITNDMTYKD